MGQKHSSSQPCGSAQTGIGPGFRWCSLRRASQTVSEGVHVTSSCKRANFRHIASSQTTSCLTDDTHDICTCLQLQQQTHPIISIPLQAQDLCSNHGRQTQCGAMGAKSWVSSDSTAAMHASYLSDPKSYRDFDLQTPKVSMPG